MNKQDQLLKDAIRSSVGYKNTTGTLRLEVFRQQKWVIYSYNMPIAVWDNNNIYIVRSTDIPTTTTHKHVAKVKAATSHFKFVVTVNFEVIKDKVNAIRTLK